jgi:hypothetical protein
MVHSCHVVEECLQFAAARGVAQLAQSLGFDLANALAGDGERPTNLLQCVLRTGNNKELPLTSDYSRSIVRNIAPSKTIGQQVLGSLYPGHPIVAQDGSCFTMC